MPKRYGIIHCYDAAKWWPIGSMVWQNALSSIILSDSSTLPSSTSTNEVQIVCSTNETDKEEWIIYDLPSKGELPKTEDNLDAVIITGSARGAYEDIPWIHTLSAWIKKQYTVYLTRSVDALPIVGGCFGAQMIGHALGGLVKPQGFYILRAEEIQLTDAYYKLPWAYRPTDSNDASYDGSSSTSSSTTFASPSNDTVSMTGAQAVPSSSSSTTVVRLLESHGDHVATLPSDGILLGTSASCLNEIFLVGNCLGIQSHPEFDTDTIIYPIIWPSAIGIGVECSRLSKDEAEHSRYTFTLPRHESMILRTIKQFMQLRKKL